MPARPEQITKHIAFLASTLPSKNIDDDAGKMRFAVYVSMLTGYSDDALAYMSRRVCETMDWFPTPRQCLELAKEYRAPPSEKWTALIACQRFDHAQFERWIDTIESGDPDLSVPQKWIDIAMTRTLLRRTADGKVVTRAKFRHMQGADKC